MDIAKQDTGWKRAKKDTIGVLWAKLECDAWTKIAGSDGIESR